MRWQTWLLRVLIEERLKDNPNILSFSFLGKCDDAQKEGLENINYSGHTAKVFRLSNRRPGFTVSLKPKGDSNVMDFRLNTRAS